MQYNLVCSPSGNRTPRFLRHIHEYVFTQKSLPDEIRSDHKPKTKLWVDLVSLFSPAMFVNSATDEDANAAFAIDKTGAMSVVAIKNIASDDEVLIAYTE